MRLSALGDVIHALPLASNAARAGHRVGWVVERPLAPLLRGNPAISDLIVTDSRKIRRRPLGEGLRELLSLREALRRFAADVVLDPQGNEKSFWVARLAAAPRVVLDDRKFRKNWSRRFSAVRVEPGASAVHVALQALSLLEAIRVPAAEAAPDARYLLGEREDAAEDFLASVPRPFALYHPGAGWGNKSWGEDRFAELAEEVRRKLGISPVVSWGPGDEVRAEELAARVRAPRIPAVGFAGLAAIASRAEFFAAGDTGPLHLADALGVRTVALFGPTRPARTGPFRGNGPVLFAALPCSPCNSRYSETKPCLRRLTASDALAALGRREPRA